MSGVLLDLRSFPGIVVLHYNTNNNEVNTLMQSYMYFNLNPSILCTRGTYVAGGFNQGMYYMSNRKGYTYF